MAKQTKQVIRTSFVRLLNARPFNKISVKEIVEDCGINRNTFYYYYQDIYDLLEDVFHEEMEKANADMQEEDLLLGLSKATDFMMKNRRAVYHIYNSINRRQVEAYLNGVIEIVLMRFVSYKAEGMRVKEEDIRLIVEFYKHALTGLMLRWLDCNMQSEEELDHVLRRINALFSGSIENSLKVAAENGAGLAVRPRHDATGDTVESFDKT